MIFTAVKKIPLSSRHWTTSCLYLSTNHKLNSKVDKIELKTL
jgi:hypothetical protein